MKRWLPDSPRATRPDGPATGMRWRRIVMVSAAMVLLVAGGVGAALLPADGGGRDLLRVLPRTTEGPRLSLETLLDGGLRDLRRSSVAGGRWSGDTLVREGVLANADLPDPAAGPPVLLVPGWSDGPPQLDDFRRRMVDAGWPEDRVVAMEFADPVGSNRAHAREVAAAAVELGLRTGADRVDVVAFSMGGLAVRHFLHFEGGKDVVRRAAFLGTPHRGTIAAVFAWGDGAREMIPGSPFLERLNTVHALEGVEMAAIRTSVDTRVVPGSSAILPGAVNVEVCCPGHTGMLRDPETFDVVHRFLLLGSGALPEDRVLSVGSSGPAGG